MTYHSHLVLSRGYLRNAFRVRYGTYRACGSLYESQVKQKDNRPTTNLNGYLF